MSVSRNHLIQTNISPRMKQRNRHMAHTQKKPDKTLAQTLRQLNATTIYLSEYRRDVFIDVDIFAVHTFEHTQTRTHRYTIN